MLIHGECLYEMCKLPDKSIDLVLCDPPYGTTELQWDVIIDFNKMWNQLLRLLKPQGALVFTAIQPFSSKLVFIAKK